MWNCDAFKVIIMFDIQIIQEVVYCHLYSSISCFTSIPSHVHSVLASQDWSMPPLVMVHTWILKALKCLWVDPTGTHLLQSENVLAELFMAHTQMVSYHYWPLFQLGARIEDNCVVM